MALGRKTGGKNFQKGVVTNPNGRPKVPDDLKGAKSLNKIEFERIMNRLLNMLPGELTEAIKSGKMKNKEMLVATVISKAIVQGDHHRLEFILNRLIGKVTERVEHTGKDGGPIACTADDLSDEEIEKRFQELKSKFILSDAIEGICAPTKSPCVKST